uniref:SANT and BTB domain-containing protein n=1 Tax=Globisporangium ultimum (strain ATCC 200006 / CBS 805.95 / DAOM BR144) TaxID=431595 RepID=K3X3Z3_GLOUD
MLSPRPRTGAARAAPSGRNVLIHVFDEYRKSTKDFVCDRELLLAKMKYFQAYLNPSNEHDEIDISVHCDVEIFEWLVKYMQQTEAEWKPRIALENIASILVSSEFLQMDALVEECIRFITTRMQAFFQLRVDFGCLSEATITKIADRCTTEDLQKLHDPKGKILSKLQRKKLDAYVKKLQDAGRTIERCGDCDILYLKYDAAALCCPKGERQVGVYGELVAQHSPKPDWKIDDFFRDLTSDKNVTWSQMVGFGHEAKFSCCNTHVFNSDDLAASGCKVKEHIPTYGVQDELGEDAATAQKSMDAIMKLPGLWDLIRTCDQLARPPKSIANGATSASLSSLRLKIATMDLMQSEFKLQPQMSWNRQLRDVLFRAHVGNLRIAGVVARNSVKEAARRWELPLSSKATQLWGEYMAGTTMLSSFYKGEERVKVALRSSAIQDLYVEAMAVGEVRGKVVLADANNLNGIGYDDGHMQVSKILYGAAKPYETTVRATGIAEADWQTFYDVSEQVPTAVRISSDKMPDSALHGEFYELDDLRFDDVPLLASSINENNDLLAYLNELIPKADLTEKNCKKIPLDFFCRCSKKGFANRLKELGASELNHVIQDSAEKGVDLTCHFCNEVYQFPLDELKSIAAELSTTGSSA